MWELCWWQHDQMSSCCHSSIRQAVSDQSTTYICPNWSAGSLLTNLRSRNMRGREQKVVFFLLWCIVCVTDLTAATWNATGSDTHIGTVAPSTLSLGFFHSPFLPSTETHLEWYSACDFKTAKICWWTLPHQQCHQKSQGRHPELSLDPQGLHSCMLRAFMITV